LEQVPASRRNRAATRFFSLAKAHDYAAQYFGAPDLSVAVDDFSVH